MSQPLSERWRSGAALLISVVALVGIILWAPAEGPAGIRRLIFGEDRLRDPADVPAGGTHAFIDNQPGDPDDPVAWDPCDAIHYEINPDGAPDWMDDPADFVEEAVEIVEHYTGLEFEYDGTTDRRPEWDRVFVPSLGRREPVLISWATEDEVRQLEEDVAGIGGSVAVEVTPGGRKRYVTGGVTLDSDSFDQLDGVFGADDEEGRAIVLHELGHLVGLDHVDSSEELMFSENLGRTDFGTGDLNGLVALGQGDCF
ncbi:matrixin family metalloprotease [Nocardioides stalactiti]|uniref:matrixin family metalloprotease n=1 Tax=Nocardioides stalactiti TaxID=2755356 RepID=UPI00160002F6|nr:matrixin family metalloprotease [Nocardioides stalactiti]